MISKYAQRLFPCFLCEKVIQYLKFLISLIIFLETAKGSVMRVSVLFFSYTPIPDKLSEGK